MYFLVALTWLSGAGSLVLFCVFLSGVRLSVINLQLSDGSLLAWDAGLCLLFFVQHSVLIRRPVRRWLTRFVPEHCYGLVYTITSGVALIALVVLWQRSTAVVYSLPGPARLLPRVLLLSALAGFVWGIRSLKKFDAFGIDRYLAHVKGEQIAETPLTIAGIYRFMRHPFYAFAIIAIWATADFTADTLLFNVMLTAWIVFGAMLEERDLIAQFGEAYRRYRRAVPMWIPNPSRRAQIDDKADAAKGGRAA